jgi:hypothetical protein
MQGTWNHVGKQASSPLGESYVIVQGRATDQLPKHWRYVY